MYQLIFAIYNYHIMKISPLPSAERGSREGSNAIECGGGRNPPEGGGRQHQHLLRPLHLLSHRGGEVAMVVRQPARALHGPAGQDRLWPELLR